MEWIVNHWLEIGAAYTALVTAASLIARLTPTDSDDKVVAFLLKGVNFLALNKPKA